MATKYKHLSLKKFGWKRVAKNTMRFGWDLCDAEEETTTTYNTTYEGTVSDNKIYVTPHTTSQSKTRVNLMFRRNSDNYTNLAAIIPLELIYNILFTARRIIGAILPIALIGIFAMFALGGNSNPNSSENELMSLYFCIGVGIWGTLILLEGILARIAGKILKCKK